MTSIPPMVLLVQVDGDCPGMYATFLHDHGFLPIRVATASVALSIAPQADVIVTDTLLPGRIDGIEFIARLKNGERTNTIPVVVLTDCAWPAERERAEHAGCDGFLTRPCLPDALLREVRRVLARRHRPDEHDATTDGHLSNQRENAVEAPLS